MNNKHHSIHSLKLILNYGLWEEKFYTYNNKMLVVLLKYLNMVLGKKYKVLLEVN